MEKTLQPSPPLRPRIPLRAAQVALLRLALLVALLPLASCEDPDTFIPFQQFGGPAGIVTGSVTYSGPPPCTRQGQVVGAAVLLAFEESLLPPPEGLGTSAAALTVVTGDTLFAGIRDQLTFHPDGKLLCGSGLPDVVVSASFSVGPLAAGIYQIRGFYDRDGDFNPLFSIFNLPTAGDVAGGAIDNAAEVLAGAPPRYRALGIGERRGDARVMPAEGFLLEGVSVSLGLALPLERPVFHLSEVLDDPFGNDDPAAIVIPSDYQLAVFDEGDPLATESSFVRLRLGAGVAPEEASAAAASPFFFPTSDPFLLYSRQDVNGDGVRDGQDHIPETPLIPALLPLGLLTKLSSGSSLTAQSPAVVLQAVTLRDGLLGTATSPPDLAEPRAEVLLALRPAVLCIDPHNPAEDGVLLNTHPDDGAGNVLIDDTASLEATLEAQFGRPVHVTYGCLPEGRYALNLVYDTGQAWTVPNEAGVCAEGEPQKEGGAICGSRPRLSSQSVVVTIGPPGDPAYCQAHPTPSVCAP